MSSDAPLRHSPLHDRHVALGAKLADFGGWLMPIDYGGAPSRLGVVAEHTAVRTDVGLFDVSHLGKATVRGPGAAAFVDSCLSNALDRIEPGQAQYSLCLDGSGGIVDDLIVYLRGADDVLLVPNAANTAEVVRRLAAAAPAGIEVADAHEAFGVLAVQGPRAEEILGKLGLPVGHPYMSFRDADWDSRPVVVCRSGYTGELGYELLPRWADAPALWDAISGLGVTPVGLGARDTLRTEMGYPLHGQDISLDVPPPQANLSWAIGWDKPAFWGREVLLEQKAAGRTRRLVGLLGDARTIPRAHMAVSREAGGPVIGEVTSGTFSPTRKLGIGLALVEASVVDGETLVVDIRGRTGSFEVVRPPFVESRVR
ncbi:MAG: glycine cleavage system aminomethyltransferase GcvT [Sporichthyaceae bacterium]